MNKDELQKHLETVNGYHPGTKLPLIRYPYRGNFPRPKFFFSDRVVVRDWAKKELQKFHGNNKTDFLHKTLVIRDIGRINTDLNPLLDTTSPWICFLAIPLSYIRIGALNEDYLEWEWTRRPK